MRYKKGELKIGLWDAEGDSKTSFSPLHDCLVAQGVENVEIEKALCTTASSPESLVSLISTSSTWKIDRLTMFSVIKNPWQHLSKAGGQGTINHLELSGDQYVKNWVKEEVEAVKINIGLLDFGSPVCGSKDDMKILSTALSLAQQWEIHKLYLPEDMGAKDWRALTKVLGKGEVVSLDVSKVGLSDKEDVKILSTALSVAQQWEIYQLSLPDNMGEDGWRVLTNVVDSGKMVDLHVSKVGLSAADDQQIDALKQATENFWVEGELQNRETHQNNYNSSENVDGELQNRRETSCCQLF